MRRERVEKGIYRTAAGGLEIGFRDATGKQRWRAVQGGIKAARAALAVEHAKRASGQLPTTKLVFADAAEAWWVAQATILRPNSLKLYEYQRDTLVKHFARQRLATITPQHVAAYVAALRLAGTADSTIRSRLAVLSAIFNHAADRLGHTGPNPVKGLRRGEKPKAAARRRALSDDEVARLLDAIPAPDRLFFELLAETGMRRSEAAGLVWADVDFTSSALDVELQLDRETEARVPLKTHGSLRTIDLRPAMTARLREHHLATGRPGPDSLIFRRVGGAPYNGGRPDKLMRTAVKATGIEATCHTLRHTHASKLIASGWDIVEVAARLGDTVATVCDVYLHEHDRDGRRANRQARLAALYGGSEAEATERSAAQLVGPSGAANALAARRFAT